MGHDGAHDDAHAPPPGDVFGGVHVSLLGDARGILLGDAHAGLLGDAPAAPLVGAPPKTAGFAQRVRHERLQPPPPTPLKTKDSEAKLMFFDTCLTLKLLRIFYGSSCRTIET